MSALWCHRDLRMLGILPMLLVMLKLVHRPMALRRGQPLVALCPWRDEDSLCGLWVLCPGKDEDEDEDEDSLCWLYALGRTRTASVGSVPVEG